LLTYVLLSNIYIYVIFKFIPGLLSGVPRIISEMSELSGNFRVVILLTNSDRETSIGVDK